ncbi:MAG TPA: ATP-binding protein [Solirubrobacterales bacterium]|nr:ATP-binding protein [Solirubrobacterales bacterium]
MAENATATTVTRRPERRFAGGLPWESEPGPGAFATAAPVVLPERAKPRPVPSAAELEALGRRTAEVAHDFNNLLSVIMVCAGEIAAGGGEQGERAEEIRAAAERGAALTRSLLGPERAEREAPRVEPAVAVGAVIDGAAKLIERTLGPRVRLSVECDEALPAVGLAAAELERILLNLAANAGDAMPAGGAAAISSTFAMVPPGDPVLGTGLHVRITFADSGAGMSAEVARRAVEPYFSTKEGAAGSGLGLAGARALVRAAGGELRIDSQPASGTTVSIYLPALSADGEPLALPATGEPLDPTTT